MKSPAYHLRPNKAAERFAFIEAIRRLPMLDNDSLEDYTYHSLGGPYLEDFRLLYEFCPEMPMVSIEEQGEVYKRQVFNRPFRTLELIKDNLSSFIRRYDPGENKSIFWLDYTGLDYTCFQDFTSLLDTVVSNSMIKITLKADPKEYWNYNPPKIRENKADQFRRMFESVLPNSSSQTSYFDKRAGKTSSGYATDRFRTDVSTYCF